MVGPGPPSDEADSDRVSTGAGVDLTIVTRVWFEAHEPEPRARIVVIPGDRQYTVVGLNRIVESVTAEIDRARNHPRPDRDGDATGE